MDAWRRLNKLVESRDLRVLWRRGGSDLPFFDRYPTKVREELFGQIRNLMREDHYQQTAAVILRQASIPFGAERWFLVLGQLAIVIGLCKWAQRKVDE